MLSDAAVDAASDNALQNGQRPWREPGALGLIRVRCPVPNTGPPCAGRLGASCGVSFVQCLERPRVHPAPLTAVATPSCLPADPPTADLEVAMDNLTSELIAAHDHLTARRAELDATQRAVSLELD